MGKGSGDLVPGAYPLLERLIGGLGLLGVCPPSPPKTKGQQGLPSPLGR